MQYQIGCTSLFYNIFNPFTIGKWKTMFTKNHLCTMTCESYDPPFIIKFDDFKDWKPSNGVMYLNFLPNNSRVDTIWCVCKEIKIYKS